jgi:sulfur relay (sulfurtransferase) complex TusBCD TusD component (DsrE family)
MDAESLVDGAEIKGMPDYIQAVAARDKSVVF